MITPFCRMVPTTYDRPVSRRSATLAALCFALLTGCTSAPKPKPKPSPPPASIAPSAGATGDYTAWQAGRSAPVADPIYPKYGNAGVDVLHYGLELTWAAESKTLTGQ